ncbi:2-dehydropantoate 2-reductase [uncultured Pseudacidovorax sp.]|uniref:ketopantoate reductase family protein n=1 Tax=uncultured Pseudacidovorax sp. TaxID=679313 RepID=UPI0025D72835|nr:2-dehydropantoate 2-reductase [uncultured Pseudacidovorax sp.]
MIGKVCIVGAGAIGGLIGTRLAAAGQAEVSALARGATLESLRRDGWQLQAADGERLQVPTRASDRPAELGPQDLVVIAVKGPALASLAPTLEPLLGPNTLVLPAMNGVPWWFCQRINGFVKTGLRSVDPEGRIAAAIGYERVLGAVVHASASTPQPGVVQHHMGRGLIVGEPDGRPSERADAVVSLLARAGFDATRSDDVRSAIWYKLWGNLTMNPVSAITGATVDRILADPLVRDFCSAAMQEAALIGRQIGCPIDEAPEARHAVTAKLGAFRTSMLQDAQAGRPLELDAIVGATHEIGQRLGVATPAIGALLGMARLFGRVHGLYPESTPSPA